MGQPSALYNKKAPHTQRGLFLEVGILLSQQFVDLQRNPFALETVLHCAGGKSSSMIMVAISE